MSSARIFMLAIVALPLAVFAHCSSSSDGDEGGLACPSSAPNGRTAALALSVSDTAFAPPALTADNNATVTLTLTNAGTKPHGWSVQCLATPNDAGCPATSCFPDGSVIAPLAPDASATTTFVMPGHEGTYTFGSSAPGDTMAGQFVVN